MKVPIEKLIQLLKDNADYFQEAASTIGYPTSREYKMMLRNHIHHQLLENQWKDEQRQMAKKKEELMDG